MATGKTIREYFETQESKIVRSTFNEWIIKDVYPELSDQYARARELQADQIFDDCIQIADDGRNDTQLDDEGHREINYDVIQRSKLRVETRKWFISKLHPGRYGDLEVKKDSANTDARKLPTVFKRGPELPSKKKPEGDDGK